MSRPRLFHSIGPSSQDSALVRKFIVDHNLQEHIEFSNTLYEGPQKALLDKIGVVEAPTMFVDDQVIRGKDAIIEWLSLNLRN